MNGDGWVCDECGQTLVVTSNRWVANAEASPPEGWYLLYKAPRTSAEASTRWEFCSIECIHRQTKPQGPTRYEDPATPDQPGPTTAETPPGRSVSAP